MWQQDTELARWELVAIYIGWNNRFFKQASADQALELALSSALLLPGGKELRSECYNALEDIFLSCYMLAIRQVIHHVVCAVMCV